MRNPGWLLLALCAACPPAGAGGSRASTPGDADQNVQAACILLGDGAVCSFTARDKPGSRCVKVLYGHGSGTVVASDTVCSGKLGANESSTLVVRFSTRPGDLCAKLEECQTKVVEPGAAVDAAQAWKADLEQNYNGPLTEAECKQYGEHLYELYANADCSGIPDPISRDDCFRNVRAERDRDVGYVIQDCLRGMERQRWKCMMAAKDLMAHDDCAYKYPGKYGY